MSSIDPNLFDAHEKDGLRLIIPARSGAVGNAPWTKETAKYRSRVETMDGTTVSQGFLKFFNISTGPDSLRISVDDLLVACERKDAIATLKLDGSLLIRSVWNDEVMLRTRGSFGYEFLDNADEMDDFRLRYPKVFDPFLFEGYSLLFEWTSPRNVIVIKYPEPELTLVGAILHIPKLPYCDMKQLEFIADYLGVPCVKWFKLNKAGWEEIQRNLETDQTIEGFVIRLNKEQDLVKVKCQPYLTKHGLKSTLTTEKLADMWFQQGQPDYKTFCDNFLSSFDEETLMWALGAISSLFDGVKEFRKIVDHMQGLAEARSIWSRKDAALRGIEEYGKTKRFSLYMNYWEKSEPKVDLLKSVLLQCTKQVEFSMFKGTTITGD